MKIAIVRGPSLNKFEMQYYEPLAKKHEVVCFGSTRPIYDIAGIDLPIVKLPCWGQVLGFIPGAVKSLFWLLGDPQGLIGLENKLSGFDIAHTAELFSYYTHQALLAKKKGRVKKVVATVSENIPFNQEWYPRQKALKRFALDNLDHILAISSKARDCLLIEGFNPEKITIVPHGLDLKRFKPGKKNERLARKLDIKKNNFVILSVGRLVWEKGFDDLLLVAKELVNDQELKDKNLKFLIVGSGLVKTKLINLRKRLRLEKEVIFSDSLPYDEMSQIYNLANIFVLASKPTPGVREQFGMVLVEAMACGLPVVSTYCGAISGTVGAAGLLIAPGDAAGLSKAIKNLILDSGKRKKLSQEGIKRVEKNFSLAIVSQKIEKVYQRVMK